MESYEEPDDCSIRIPDILFSSSHGLLKGYDCRNQCLISLPTYKEEPITSICWGNQMQSCIYIGTKSGKIKCFSFINQMFKDFDIPEFDKIESPIVNIYRDPSKSVFVSKKAGHIGVIENQKVKLKIETPKNLDVIKFYNNFFCTAGKDHRLRLWDVNSPKEPIFCSKNVRNTTLNLQVPIWISDISYVPDYGGKLIIAGTRFGEMQLYDVRCGTKKPVARTQWRLSHRIGKVEIGSAKKGAFLPDPWTQPPITCIYALPVINGLQALAGNAKGGICKIDYRVPKLCLENKAYDELSFEDSVAETRAVKSIGARGAVHPKHVKRLIPANGCITGITSGSYSKTNIFPVDGSEKINEPFIFITSIDRTFRVHHAKTLKRLGKIFVKIPVNNCLMRNSASFEVLSRNLDLKLVEDKRAFRRERKRASEKEDDDLWNAIEQQENNPAKPPITGKKRVKSSLIKMNDFNMKRLRQQK